MTIKINGTNTTAQPSITGADTDTGLVYGTDQVQVVTGGTTRATVDSSGNVGINQVPTRELSLHSPNNNNALIHFTNDDTGETASDGALVGIDGNEDLNINNQESGKNVIFRNNGERMRIDSSGNVGIGTSPSTELHVAASSGYSELRLAGASGSGASVEFYESTTKRGDIYTDPSSNIVFRNNTERLRIQSGGGISFNGDTAAANALDDYEEGTWTPTVTGGATGISFDSSNCVYVKVGNLVHLQFEITGFTGTNNNTLTLAGFPFAPATEGVGTVMTFYVSYPSNTTTITVYYSPIQWRFYGSGSGAGWDPLTGNEFSSGDVIGALTYRV